MHDERQQPLLAHTFVHLLQFVTLHTPNLCVMVLYCNIFNTDTLPVSVWIQ